MVTWVAGVLESAERFWQPLNPVHEDEEHSVVFASVTSDNCQLVPRLSPVRAAENALLLFLPKCGQTVKLTCRRGANRNDSVE